MNRHILDLDLGNTRIKWRYSADGAAEEGALAYEDFQPDSLLEIGTVHRVRVASVVGSELLERVAAASRRLWKVEPEIASVQNRCAGVQQGYENSSQLGVDRWLAILAAYASAPQGCVVVSCGTAVTVDLVTARGEHLGGYIVPGLELMRSALFARTNKVKLEALHISGDLTPGRDTQQAVTRGLLLMVRGLVENARSSLMERGETPAIIISGGDGQRLQPLLAISTSSTNAQYRPNLVLDGLPLALP